MIRKISALVVAVAMIALGLPVPAAAAPARHAQAAGQISGTAQNQGQALANHVVRLRSIDSGQLVGTTTSNAAGQFWFTGLTPGNFMIEIVDLAGNIVGTSAPISLASGAMVASGVTVAASAAGAAGAAAAGAATGGSFFTSTAGIVLMTAAAVGVTAGVVAANGPASPSR